MRKKEIDLSFFFTFFGLLSHISFDILRKYKIFCGESESNNSKKNVQAEILSWMLSYTTLSD